MWSSVVLKKIRAFHPKLKHWVLLMLLPCYGNKLLLHLQLILGGSCDCCCWFRFIQSTRTCPLERQHQQEHLVVCTFCTPQSILMISKWGRANQALSSHQVESSQPLRLICPLRAEYFLNSWTCKWLERSQIRLCTTPCMPLANSILLTLCRSHDINQLL